MNPFENLKTVRLNLRMLMMKDSGALFTYRTLPEICRFQSWKPVDIHEIEQFIDKNSAVLPDTAGTWLQLAVCLKDGLLVGDIGIHFLDDVQVEIGYTLSPEHQGNGYAAEAVRAVLDYLFLRLMKHRVTASVDPDNIRSAKLLEKIGFRKEAHFIKSIWMDGKWCDDVIYAILSDEWKKS